MIKRALTVAAIMIATPGFSFSQDIFWSFDNASAQTTAEALPGTSGTAYLFAAETFYFDAADIDITISDPSIFSLTGGQGSMTYGGSSIKGFNSVALDVDLDQDMDGVIDSGLAPGASARFFAVNITENGISFLNELLFDPYFVPGVGNLLAEVNYDVSGLGSSTLTADMGTRGVLRLPTNVLNPSFGSATLTAVPEPSSVMQLILGSIGLVAGRRRARRITFEFPSQFRIFAKSEVRT